MSDGAPQLTAETHGHFLDEPELPRGVTRFWLIRHAVVEAQARKVMYGALDVDVCAETMVQQTAGYRSLAKRLPQGAVWVSSPLKRAKDTANKLQEFSPDRTEKLQIDESFIEQSIGDWHGTPHGDFPALLSLPPNPFWSLAASETPPAGESMLDVAARIGRALEKRASDYEGRDTVIVSHGGAIRAALAHALQVHPETALRFSIQNLSLSIIERIDGLWRVIKVNELPDFGE